MRTEACPCGFGHVDLAVLTSSFTGVWGWGWKLDWITSGEREVNEDHLLRKFCCKVKTNSTAVIGERSEVKEDL